MNKIYLYIKKRFPLLPLFIFSILTISAISKSIQVDNFPKVISLSFIYTSFLFHLRILDEFKDYRYDKKNHPNRPVVSGQISLQLIRLMGLINFLLLITVALIVSNLISFSLLTFVLIYTALMFKEFFIKNFYEKSSILYLLSHQIAFLPLYLFFFYSLNPNINLITNFHYLALFIYTLIPIILIEIGRKMNYRYNASGKKTNDTYFFVWGEKTTISVFSILIFLAGTMSLYIQNLNLFITYAILIFSLLIFTGAFFYRQFIIKYHMAITIFIVLILPALLLL